MLVMSVTFQTFHAPKGRLKLLTPSNMCCISVTLATFRASEGQSNLLASPNMLFMLVAPRMEKVWFCMLRILSRTLTFQDPKFEVSICNRSRGSIAKPDADAGGLRRRGRATGAQLRQVAEGTAEPKAGIVVMWNTAASGISESIKT